jgi:hypothetical protein
MGKLSLTKTQKPPTSEDTVAKRSRTCFVRVVPQEGDDSGDEPQLRGGTVGFPVADRRLIDVQMASHIALQKAEIDPSLAEVVAQGREFTRVGGWEWLLANELDMAKWQRNHAPVATTETRSRNAPARRA